jgi:uncharacterized protein (TIGR04141 family)
MSKSRSFSIYLLKEGFDPDTALRDDHHLEHQEVANTLPSGAKLFVLDNAPHPPWWKAYFGIDRDLNQVSKGALLFLPIADRYFALSFGHVHQNLKDVSYEYDFGLRVTLNCVDPDELKSTDSLDPGMGRRQRTQLPVGSDLTLFDFDRDSSILRRLTGKVKPEYKTLYKHATGASNLRISSDVQANELAGLCSQLLQLYQSEEFKTTFSDIQNISPVRDPILVEKLNEKLIAAFRAKDENLNLTVPDIIHYEDNVCASFTGAGSGLIYNDIFMGLYYEYLEQHEVELNTIGIEDLQRHDLLVTNEDGSPRERHSIYKSLIFDTMLAGETEAYHLCEGNWYKVEQEYVARLEAYLDPRCKDIPLPAYDHDSEGAYNNSVANTHPSFICLDEENISLVGQTEIEPCDQYSVEDGIALFYHIKVSTLSSMLSHLFNQGTNAIELIRLESQALENLKRLIRAKAIASKQREFLAPLNTANHGVVFAIVTHKDKSKKSRNLPLFSRISLMRNFKALQTMNVKASYGFVEDKRAKAAGKKKTRKKKAAKPA